jgi:DNA-binding SARP family transcriptional activator
MIRLRALGQCVFELGEHHVTPESDVLFAVLLLLTSKAGHPVPRAEVLELLWPESDENSARHRLRQAVYQLKKLGAPLDTPESAIVVRKSDVEVDYVVCRDDREALAAFVSEPQHLEVLPRYSPAFSKPFARWVEGERDRVRATLRHHLLEGITAHRARGDRDRAIVFARACLELDGLNEDAVYALAESLAVGGEASEALTVVDRYRDALRALGETCPRPLVDLRARIADSARKLTHASRGQSELVGRAPIVQEIDAWIRNGSRSRRTLAILGDAGIGKTRLLAEATRLAAVHGVRLLEYRSSANGETRSLVGLLDILPRLLSLPGAVGCHPESYARLMDLTRGVLLSSSIPTDTTESAFRFAVLRRSVLDLFEAVLSEGDLILSLDDAHALDQPSLDILLDATRLRDRSLALILALRPEGPIASFLETHSDLLVVRVPRLEPHDARLVLTRNLSRETAVQRANLVEWAVDLANGNPFFLTELSAHCRSKNPVAALPQSLQVALETKLDALGPTARLLIQACAVLAQHSTLSRLETMLGLPPHGTAIAIAELEQSGLIAFRDGWVGCRHHLVADAVVQALGQPLGAYLHRRCAVILDRELEISPLPSIAWDCAQHWEAADEPGRALDLTGLIVNRLLALGLPAAAADLCERAARYCRTAEQQAALLLWQSGAQRLLYNWNGVVTALEQRKTILSSLGRPLERYSEEEIALLEARWWRGYDGRALLRALQCVSDRRSPALHRLQMATVGLIVADNQQRRREARRLFEAVEAMATNSPREDIEKARARLVFHTAFGNLDIAVSAAAQVVNAERAAGYSAALLRALRWSSIPLKFTGDRPAAFSSLAEAYADARRLTLIGEMWHTAEYMTDLAFEFDDLELANEWATACNEHAERGLPNAAQSFVTKCLLSRVELMKSNYDGADAFLREAKQLSPGSILRTRAQETFIATDVIVCANVRSRRITQRMVDTLRKLHLRTRESGIRDYEVGALLIGLSALGRAAEGLGLYDDYMRMFRRSRVPIQGHLMQARELLGNCQ